MTETYIKEYVPRSWFHPKGIFKVLKRFWHRLPNVSGCLFATFSIDREYMRAQGYGPSEAFDITRDRIRKIFYELRQGVEWEGKTYTIKSEYCTKVEFHEDEEGWPHYHVIWLTRRFIPADLLAHLWSHGRTNVKRIKNSDFHYLLKYVCKSGKIPEWVQDRTTIRILQPSRGFLKPDENAVKTKSEPTGKTRKLTTIGERLKKWERLALIATEDLQTGLKKCRELYLWNSFKHIFDRLILSVALDGRYMGNGKIIIHQQKELYPWLLNLHQNALQPD